MGQRIDNRHDGGGHSVNVERACEIMESKDMIPVHLDTGQPVWIEQVDTNNGVATVQVGANPGNTETVAVQRLHEAH